MPSRETIALVHDRNYVDAYCDGTLGPREMRRIGFPWSPGLAHRTQIAVGGTIRAMELAVEHGLACSTAGGTHHAHRDFGSGFCIFNDIAVAARVALERGLASRVLVIDLDVHQGDGTAAIFADEPNVTTFSMHCDRNFPLRKVAGDVDVALDADLDDDAYLAVLAEHLPALLDRVSPDLVLYDAGVDVHRDDRLGRLGLSDAGIAKRDMFVLERCATRGIPAACVIGGGYSHDLPALASRHALLHRTADGVFRWHHA